MTAKGSVLCVTDLSIMLHVMYNLLWMNNIK